MQKSLGAKLTARRRPLGDLSSNKARPGLEPLTGKHLPGATPATPAGRATAAAVDVAHDRLLFSRSDLAGVVSESQKSLGANSTARGRPLSLLSGNKARPALEPVIVGKPPPPAAPATPAARATADEVEKAFHGLLLAGSDLAGLVSQIDELISDALKCQTVSKRATQEIESFNGFLTDTKASLKQWSSRLKQALETDPVTTQDISKNTRGTCLNTAAKGNANLISGSSKLPDTDPVESPRTNFTEADTIVSPSPLVSWHNGSCMVEGGKQLFHLTPLPKSKACSSRCPASKAQLKTASSIDQLNNHPDLEQSVKVKESWTGTMTPHVASANKVSVEDKLCSPCTLSIQKRRAVPRSCLKTAFSSKQQLFSPISEGSRKEDTDSDGLTGDDKRSGSSDEISKDLASRYDIYGLSNGLTGDDKRSGSSDEISKDLASRYDIYGLNRSRKEDIDSNGLTGDDKRSGSSDEISKDLASRYDIYGIKRPTGQDEDTLEWFLSPLKTMVLTDPSDNNPLPTPTMSHVVGKQNVPDEKPIQTPAVHCKALLGTPWKGMESTNLKGRVAGETTLKKELWTRFEAATPNALHFDKARFQKNDPKCLLGMLEEEAL